MSDQGEDPIDVNVTPASSQFVGAGRAELVAGVLAIRAKSAELARKYAQRGKYGLTIAFWSTVGLCTDVERFSPIPGTGFVLFLLATFGGAFAVWCWERWRFENAVATAKL